MKVSENPLASALVKGAAKVAYPPTEGYARLGRLWVIPGARGYVRLMARVKDLPEPPKPLREAGVKREPTTGFPQLRTADEKVARQFIEWATGVIEKAEGPAPAKRARAKK